MSSNYIFTSERLGFRIWENKDLTPMCNINNNENVMEFFPSVQTKNQTQDFIHRMQQLYTEKAYCYFAVEELITQKFIGFIGLSYQKFYAKFTPCTDIGWRIASEFWNKGYATEGAKRCLSYAFNTLQLQEIYATAPLINERSIHIMKKIGMQFHSEFKHPLLVDFPSLKNCVAYKISS